MTLCNSSDDTVSTAVSQRHFNKQFVKRKMHEQFGAKPDNYFIRFQSSFFPKFIDHQSWITDLTEKKKMKKLISFTLRSIRF